jgi:hypothetical protein
MIYAILPDNTSEFVPTDMIDAARASATTADTAKEPLTQSQISQLTAILTGGGFKRANSKAAAEARFVNVAIENGFSAERAADLLEGPFAFSEGVLRRHVGGDDKKPNPHAASNALIANAIARDPELAAMVRVEPAKADDYPAPAIGKSASRRAAIDLLKNDAFVHSAAEALVAAATAKPVGKRAASLEAAQRGELPAVPDFSAETHRRYRNKLAGIVALAEAGNIEGLKAVVINPISSSPKAMLKYRDLCVIALETKAMQNTGA